MDNKKKTGVRAKLFTAFCLIIAFTVAITALSLTQMFSTNKIINDVDDLLTERHPVTNKALVAAIIAHNVTYEFLDNPAKFDEAGQKKLKDICENLTATVNALPMDMHPDLFAKVKENAPKFTEIALGEFSEAVKTGDPVKIKPSYSKLSDLYEAITGPLDGAVEREISSAASKVNHAKSKTLITIIAALACVAIVIAVIIAATYSGRIVRSLNSAVKSAQIIGDGDLSVPVKVTSNDEFGTLQHSLEKMRGSWNELVSLIKSAVDSVEGSVGRIQDVTARINESAKNTQNHSMTVAAASDEMVSTTGDIAKNCETAAQSANKTNQTTQDGVASIQETIGIIKDQAAKSEDDPRRRGRQGIRGRRRRGPFARLPHFEVHPGDHPHGHFDAKRRPVGQRVHGAVFGQHAQHRRSHQRHPGCVKRCVRAGFGRVLADHPDRHGRRAADDRHLRDLH